jgi:hypothetical protein
MAERLRFRCPHCEAKLEASFRLLGSMRECPKCRGPVMVRLPVPSDADIVLVEASNEKVETAGN